VASLRGITTKEVVDIHSGCEYLAWFLGFVPGFAYLGEVPDWIAAPRRSVPRKSVPTGSVGIAGKQTGVYPRSTPGGWNLIGRTSLQMFDPMTGKSVIEPGDRVRFVPL
jgi:KipI family sensor histidine kinase inhibitor